MKGYTKLKWERESRNWAGAAESSQSLETNMVAQFIQKSVRKTTLTYEHNSSVLYHVLKLIAISESCPDGLKIVF